MMIPNIRSRVTTWRGVIFEDERPAIYLLTRGHCAQLELLCVQNIYNIQKNLMHLLVPGKFLNHELALPVKNP